MNNHEAQETSKAILILIFFVIVITGVVFSDHSLALILWAIDMLLLPFEWMLKSLSWLADKGIDLIYSI